MFKSEQSQSCEEDKEDQEDSLERGVSFLERGVSLKSIRAASSSMLDMVGLSRVMEKSQDDAPGSPGQMRNLTEQGRELRLYYLSLSTQELRELCDERNIGFSLDDGRMALISMLEQDENSNQKWVEGSAFEGFFLVVVVINAIFIGCEIDYPHVLTTYQHLQVSVFFTLLFTAEIVTKVVVLGWQRYLKDPWNLFDIVVTTMVVVQMSATYSSISGRIYQEMSQYVAGDCIQILRLCRLFRLAKFFKELGMLIKSFVMSIRALAWIIVLLVLWFYLSACFATNRWTPRIM